MDWRKRRQITIFIIFIFFIALIGLFFYSRYQPIATCFDNKQNGNEEGVDCGGSCISCKLLEVHDVEVVWTKLLTARPGSFDALASIKNPNIYFGSMNVDYEFELLDETGAPVALRTGTTFLLPSERITLIEPNIRTQLKARTVLFKIRNVQWGRVYDIAPRYDLGLGKRDYSVIETTAGIRQSVVDTSIYNNSAENFSQVFVSVFLYDAEKNIIAANKTVMENVSAGEVRPIRFVWPQEITTPVAGIEGEVRVNSFIK